MPGRIGLILEIAPSTRIGTATSCTGDARRRCRSPYAGVARPRISSKPSSNLAGHFQLARNNSSATFVALSDEPSPAPRIG
ncbi:hypothetical protein B0E45_29405 [Sinorhizobium sp. A49]|nr:hypothetical protein B0E45_29405 [Sinorhizobium sp. A49]